jgi:hypothetical protein
MCHVNNWAVNGWFTMLISDRLGIVLGSPVVPVIALSCNNCGNTVMINAIIAGVMPEQTNVPTGATVPFGGTGGTNG